MKPLSIECPNLTCIINQSWPGWGEIGYKIDVYLLYSKSKIQRLYIPEILEINNLPEAL